MDDPKPLTPEARRRPDARGTAVAIDGGDWLLADYVPSLDPVWDALYDQNALRGSYDNGTLVMAAVRLLYAANDLTPDEAAGLALLVPPGDYVPAVEAALYGPDRSYRSYSDWALGSLLSNAIDPDRLPPAMLTTVLEMLVMTGRAVPPSKFISSVEAAAVRTRRIGR